MKFNAEILKKAWAIYKEIKTKNPLMPHRTAWRAAIADTIRFFVNLKKGVIRFVKMDETVAERKVGPLSLLGYDTTAGAGSLFTVVDLEKVAAGLKNVVISFHNFQMM